MKLVKLLIATIALMSLSPVLFAQEDYDFYLQKARQRIAEGDCDGAQRSYNVYKDLSKKIDRDIEKQIDNCRAGYNSSMTSSYVETTMGINMKMIWVEGGDFIMGCTSSNYDDCKDEFYEANSRHVTIDGFYIGMFEVSQAQWRKVMGTSPSAFKGDDKPVESVDWNDAMDFCRLLSKKTGKNYTLPTEAQWEYAARGGMSMDDTRYSGSNYLDEVAWYWDNSSRTTHSCGTKKPNGLGIYDMSGNVWEWCRDWFSYSYNTSDTDNPMGPLNGSRRVMRGSSWYCPEGGARVWYHGGSEPDFRRNDLGFRIVLIPERNSTSSSNNSSANQQKDGGMLLYSQIPEFYCDGVYDNAKCTNGLHTPELAINRNHFRVVFSFIPSAVQSYGKYPNYVLTFTKYRIFCIGVDSNGTVLLKTNNMDNIYRTNTKCYLNEYTDIDMEYNNGIMTINGQRIVVDMDVSHNCDNRFHSINYGTGIGAFKGYIKNLKIYSYPD